MTATVELRGIEPSDQEAVHDWARMPDSCRYQAWGPNTESDTRAFVDRAVAAWSADPILDRTYVAEVDGSVVGSGVLHIRSVTHAQGEITYLVHPKLWGRGIGTAVAERLLRIGFTERGLHRIVGTCDPRNTASATILRRVGMTYEGRSRHTMRVDDGWRDSEVYSILEPEWSRRREPRLSCRAARADIVFPMPDNPDGPTCFPELNELLGDLTRRVGEILADDLIGVYLCGSFAVGDADIHSDCDFLVVLRRRMGRAAERRIRRLHDEIPTRPGHWTRHLEGSYPVATELRGLAGMGREWLYIDHGWREMRFDTHCNNEVTRWSLREHGVTLFGPEPKSLVDEVPATALKARMLRDIPRFLEDLASWASWDVAWTQRYAVTTYCRMLNTLETGRVVSKLAALDWAINTLDRSWRPLLRQVREDRRRGWNADEPPRPGSIESTISFSDYVLERAEA